MQLDGEHSPNLRYTVLRHSIFDYNCIAFDVIDGDSGSGNS
jgi:hypothetical protein